MKNKRKRRYPIQKAFLAVDPMHAPQMPESISTLLPSLDVLPEGKAYTVAQEQLDCGSWYFFFKTRWQPTRDYLAILGVNASDEVSLITGVLQEHPDTFYNQDFMDHYGYDIDWDVIYPMQWDDFCKMCSVALNSQLSSITKDTRYDNIAFSGSLMWFDKDVRDSISKVGIFTRDHDFKINPKYKDKPKS